mgnify:CR=1 FL=1
MAKPYPLPLRRSRTGTKTTPSIANRRQPKKRSQDEILADAGLAAHRMVARNPSTEPRRLAGGKKVPVTKTPSPNTQGSTKDFFGPPASAPQVGPDPRTEPLRDVDIPLPGTSGVPLQTSPHFPSLTDQNLRDQGIGTKRGGSDITVDQMHQIRNRIERGVGGVARGPFLTDTPPGGGPVITGDPRTATVPATHRPPDEQARLAESARRYEKRLLEGERTTDRKQDIDKMRGRGEEPLTAERAGRVASDYERMDMVKGLGQGIAPERPPTIPPPGANLHQHRQRLIQWAAWQRSGAGGGGGGGVSGVNWNQPSFIPTIAQLQHAQKTGRPPGTVRGSFAQHGEQHLWNVTREDPYREEFAELRTIEQQLKKVNKGSADEQVLRNRKAELQQKVRDKRLERKADLDKRRKAIKEERKKAQDMKMTVKDFREHEAIKEAAKKVADDRAERVKGIIEENIIPGEGGGVTPKDIAQAAKQTLDIIGRQRDATGQELAAAKDELKEIQDKIIQARQDESPEGKALVKALIAQRNTLGDEITGFEEEMAELKKEMNDAANVGKDALRGVGAKKPGEPGSTPDGGQTPGGQSTEPTIRLTPQEQQRFVATVMDKFPDIPIESIVYAMRNPDTLDQFRAKFGDAAADLVEKIRSYKASR